MDKIFLKNLNRKYMNDDSTHIFDIIQSYSEKIADKFSIDSEEIFNIISLYGNQLDLSLLIQLDDKLNHYSYLVNLDTMNNNVTSQIASYEPSRVAKIIIRISEIYESIHNKNLNRFNELSMEFSKFSTKYMISEVDKKLISYCNMLRNYGSRLFNKSKITKKLKEEIILL